MSGSVWLPTVADRELSAPASHTSVLVGVLQHVSEHVLSVLQALGHLVVELLLRGLLGLGTLGRVDP